MNRSRGLFKSLNFSRHFYRINNAKCKKCLAIYLGDEKYKRIHYVGKFFITFTFAGIFFKSENDDETPENELIMMIKRSILCIQREEFDKAEQMLHLALKTAQELQMREGITYIFDVMANLAMERNQFDKAEKLFAEVMKRLFGEGYPEDNIKILHISGKIAHMSHLNRQFEKAEQGFIWTLEKIEKKLKLLPDDTDLIELYGMTKNWYAQLLIETDKLVDAKRNFTEALQVLTTIHGKINEEAITILNNLSVTSARLNDFQGARTFLEEAIEIAQKLPDSVQVGVIQANLGLLYLKDGLIKQAKEICSSSYRFGKKVNDENVIKQAEHCLDQINAEIRK